MAHQRLLSLGEIGWDHRWVLDQLPRASWDCHLLFEQETPGGCALNTACCLQALGAQVTLDGNFVGNDATGAKIRRYVEARGIDSRIATGEFEKTPVCHVFVEENSGNRSFMLSYENIQRYSAERTRALVAECLTGKFSHAFVQVYLQDLSREFLRGVDAFRALWLLTQDVGPDSEFVPRVDAIQNSLDEKDAFDAETARQISERFFARGGRVKQLFLTSGARGIAYCERGQAPRLFPAVPVGRIVDTTGCGDAFRAGVMKGLSEGRPIDQAILVGQQAGARKAGLLGSHF